MTLVEAEITIPSDALELGQIIRDGGGAKIELTQMIPAGNDQVPYFWVEADDLEAFEESVRGDERVANLTQLHDDAGRSLYQVEWATELDGLIAALTEHNLFVEQAIGDQESWEFRLRGADHGNFSAFQRTLREKDIPIVVRRVTNPADPVASQYGLSDKQHEALTLAFTEGYFDVPRATKLTDLAATLDISHQSFSRRMSRGLHSLLDTTIMERA